jgi:BirA family biotin operon repressor/biotin-[acetyl-CoA-carboxylase] ligase
VEFSQQRFVAAYQVVQLCDPVVGMETRSPPPLHVFATLMSTNQTAWDLLGQAIAEGTAILALEQTAGRGQWGRQWTSLQGGLYLSVVLTPNLRVEYAAQLTLCIAWGIATALRTIPGQVSGVAEQLPVQLKWPNDLVVDGRKLGGILTETRVHQGQITTAVVGVGINWINSVPEPGITMQSILRSQPVPLIESLEMLTAITLHGILSGYYRWQQIGIEPILPRYLELLAHRDRPILIHGQLGTIIGITPTGELQVQLQSAPTSDQDFIPLPPTEIRLQPGSIRLGYDW